MKEIPIKFLQKNTCLNEEDKCNHLQPYSILQLFGKNKLTKREKEENLQKYESSCSNLNGSITTCCDRYDTSREGLLKKLKINKIKGRPEYDKYGNLSRITVCNMDDKSKCKKKDGFRNLNGYELCKAGANFNNKVKNKNYDITDFNKDCHLRQCNPQENLPDILGNLTKGYSYEIDNNMSNAIKDNNISLITHYLQSDPSLKYRILTHNSEGNTIYHEALKFDSGNNLYYIFKQGTSQSAQIENSEGETLLHMALSSNNINAIMLCIKLGSDINAKNKKDETPIYNAIKKNNINNVRMAINNMASLIVKDKKGNTPLHHSVLIKEKNVDIVRLLVERGSNIKTKNNAGKTPLQLIHEVKEPVLRDDEIRTYLEQVTVKSLGLEEGKFLSPEKTRELRGILYDVEGMDRLPEGKDTNFKVSFDFNAPSDQATFPDDLNYPKSIDYKKLQPKGVDINDNIFSHEPYFNKFENLQKDKIQKLKQTIILTNWDKKHDKTRKLEIIDHIMEDKLDFETYKYEVMNDNGVTIEQEHLLEQTNLNNMLGFDDGVDNSLVLKAKRNEDNNEVPFDISMESDPPNISYPMPAPEPSFEEPIIVEPPTISPPLPISPVIEETYYNIFTRFMEENSFIIIFIVLVITIFIIAHIYVKSMKNKKPFNMFKF